MKETKTIQVYPDDEIVNSTIEEYESFCWEVIGNQRCQEFDGTTHGIDGSTTRHYSTFNKITFTREKDLPWYQEVTALEREYNSTKDTVKSYKANKPVLKTVKPEGSIGCLLGLWLYCMFLVPGIIYSIARAAKKSSYKKQYQKELEQYESVYPAKIRELNAKLDELRARAARCMSTG